MGGNSSEPIGTLCSPISKRASHSNSRGTKRKTSSSRYSASGSKAGCPHILSSPVARRPNRKPPPKTKMGEVFCPSHFRFLQDCLEADAPAELNPAAALRAIGRNQFLADDAEGCRVLKIHG